MSEILLSVGLDVGTSTTQLVVSELKVENRASGFAVPEMVITGRNIRCKSAVHFTPLVSESLVDGQKLRQLVTREYARAGIRREDVDTGAVIITGETSRKENARAVLDSLADFAGDFVVATAGPHLESLLAAKGAGAVEASRVAGKPVLHMDIGGGTSNLALMEKGDILQTGCLNVGGRLLKRKETGEITYLSPVLSGITGLKVGNTPGEEEIQHLAQRLVQGLEMAAGLRPPTELLEALWTKECGEVWEIPREGAVLSFSGGVAACMEKQYPGNAFGDMGPALGKAIRESRLCAGEYRLGRDAIRATVIGAGCHSTQLSGSTVFYQNVQFPLKNLPVVESLLDLSRQEGLAVTALRDVPLAYSGLQALAAELLAKIPGDILLCMEADAAKALGQALALRGGPARRILCIDRIRLRAGCYLDVGAPVAGAFPVVVKTLVLEKGGRQ